MDDLARRLETVVKRLEPTKQLIYQLEDNVRETEAILKDARNILAKAKTTADEIARNTR